MNTVARAELAPSQLLLEDIMASAPSQPLLGDIMEPAPSQSPGDIMGHDLSEPLLGNIMTPAPFQPFPGDMMTPASSQAPGNMMAFVSSYAFRDYEPPAIAILTSRNLLIIPESVYTGFPGVKGFEVSQEAGRIILTPIPPEPVALEEIHQQLAAQGLTEQDITDAVKWARGQS